MIGTQHASGTPTARPTTIRHRVLGFLVVLAFMTYLDRACMASIKPAVMADLSLSMNQMGAIFSAFALAYGLFEIPTGHWGDRIGTRRVLGRIVTWWSTFTVASGLTVGYSSMLAVRFLFGMGEAGAFPNAALTMSRWIPSAKRGLAQGMFFAMAHFGGAVTPLIVGVLLQVLHWRVILVVFGILGFIWVFAWHRWFRDDPSEHPGVNSAELALITAGRAKREPHLDVRGLARLVFTSRSMILLCLIYAANGYGFYFIITWLPDYLRSFHHFSVLEIQLYAGLPLLLSVPADLLGGQLTDWLTARYGARTGRSAVGCLGYVLAGAAVFLSLLCSYPATAAVIFAFGVAFSMFTLGATWSACMAIGGSHTGTVGAVMNSASQIGAFSSPLISSILFQFHDRWTLPIVMIGWVYALAALAWLFTDSRSGIVEEPGAA